MFKTNTLDLEIVDVAIKAKDYARNCIIKGATQLENNQFSKEQDAALLKSVYQVTTLYEHEGINRYQNIPGLSEKEKMYMQYETILEISKKYSLGNCYELALHALDYMLSHNRSISAEIIEIQSQGPNDVEMGEHTFLLINRDVRKNIEDFSSWQKAVICDPWRNMVIHVSEINMEELKVYYYDSEHKKNMMRSFNPDPRYHTIEKDAHFNSQYLDFLPSFREQGKVIYFKQISSLINKERYIFEMLNKYLLRINLLEKDFKNENMAITDPEIKNIVSEKLAMIENISFKIGQAIRELQKEIDKQLPADFLENKLTTQVMSEMLLNVAKIAINATELTQQEKLILYKKKKQGLFSRFFKPKSEHSNAAFMEMDGRLREYAQNVLQDVQNEISNNLKHITKK